MKAAIKIPIWIIGSLVLLLALAFSALQIWFAVSIQPVEPFELTEEEASQLEFYSQSESWFLDHLQGPLETIDGQTLDPKLQYMLEQARPNSEAVVRSAPFIFATPWGRAFIRNQVDRQWRLLTKATAVMAHVEDRMIEGRDGPIPIRIYRPEVVDEDTPLPVLVYHHGGGWIFASIVAMDRVSRLIANEAKIIVVSVDYRLAPEHPYPAASDDGEDAFLWVQANANAFGGDPKRIGVGGDSAGGHVAINIAQRQVAAQKPGPRAMLLFYPGAGFPQNDASYKLFGNGYSLDASFIEFILPLVFQGFNLEEADDFMNPANAARLEGMPPTIIATPGFDILRDSGRRFTERLQSEGVLVTYTNYPSLTHSFLQFSAVIEDADQASTINARRFGELIRKSAPRFGPTLVPD